MHRFCAVYRFAVDVLPVQAKADEEECTGKGLRNGLGATIDRCAAEPSTTPIVSRFFTEKEI